MKKIILSLVTVIVSLLFWKQDLFAYTTQDEEISSCLEEFRDSTKCKNVSIVIYDNGEVTYLGDPDGLYQIGSMTKAFTGLAVQKLIKEGKIDEQTRVDEVFPGFIAYYDSEPEKITVNHLLHQTSGFTNNETLYPSGTPEMTLADWVLSISGKELESKPGEKYTYSNVNYNLLGAMIEKVTGISYKDYMENEILKPLGLKHTYVGRPENGKMIVEGSRLGYRNTYEYSVPVSDSKIPAGYFYSNVSDMGRWIQIWLGSADIPNEYEDMICCVKEQLINEGDYYSGWQRFEADQIGHSGGTPNYTSRAVFSDSRKIGVCVLTDLNVASSTDSLCNGIVSVISGSSPGGIKEDVWTIFDRIFTVVTIIGILLMIVGIYCKSKRVYILCGAITGGILAALCIVLPLIFGSGLGQILFVWAPYSLAGGMLVLLFDALIFGILACRIKRECGLKKDR